MSDIPRIAELRVLEAWCPSKTDTGSIVLWLYPDGAQVSKGEVVAEFMVSKVTLEVEAPEAGVLRIRLEPEIEAYQGELLAEIHH